MPLNHKSSPFSLPDQATMQVKRSPLARCWRQSCCPVRPADSGSLWASGTSASDPAASRLSNTCRRSSSSTLQNPSDTFETVKNTGLNNYCQKAYSSQPTPQRTSGAEKDASKELSYRPVMSLQLQTAREEKSSPCPQVAFSSLLSLLPG